MKGFYVKISPIPRNRILPSIKYFCQEPYEGLLGLKYVLVSNIASQGLLLLLLLLLPLLLKFIDATMNCESLHF